MAEISYSSNSPDLAIFDYHPIPKEPWVFFLPAPDIFSWLESTTTTSPASSTTYPKEMGRVSYKPPEPGSKPSLKMAFRFLTELFILYFFLGGVMGGDYTHTHTHIYIYIYIPQKFNEWMPKMTPQFEAGDALR